MDLFSTFLRNTLTWWQWSLLAMIPPAIIALYFLKLRRTPLEVPSTYLWQKSIEDLHVNSIWQRLRQNLLLFLQLLLLLLAVLALLRPGWSGSQLVGDRFIFLVDNSASMSATDVQPTRLDEAKRRTHELIDEMPAGSKAMIISFSNRAQVVQEFSDNRALLHRRTDAIAPTVRSTSLREALELAAGLANPGRTASDARDVAVAEALPADVYIFSDGRFPTVEGFSLGNLKPIYVPIGKSETENLAITAFNTRPTEAQAGRQQAFARLANFGDSAAEVEIELLLDGETIDADRFSVEPDQEHGVVFDLGEVDQGAVSLLLSPNDAFESDNAAYAAVNPPRKAKVLLVSPGNEALVWAVSTNAAVDLADVEMADPAHLTTKEYNDQADNGTYDLIIYDQCRPKTMPQANTVFVGTLPPLASWKGDGDQGAESETVAGPQIIDTDRAHPLFQWVELGNVSLAESIVLEPPSGGTMLVDSSQGTICAIAPRQAFEDLVLGFEILGTTDEGEAYANTNWHVRPSFPTFWFGVLSYLGGHLGEQRSLSVRTGEPIRLTGFAQSDELEVVMPDDRRKTLTRGADGRFQFHETDQLGQYELRQDEKVVARLAVNLFDPSESNVAPRDEGTIQIGHVDVEGQSNWEGARRELWKILLILALAVLLFEWYIYNRRVYI